MSSTNSPTDNVPYNVPNAALRGATLAFAAKPLVKPKPVTQTRYPGINGALSPANVASRASSVSPERRLERTQSMLEPGVSRSPSTATSRPSSMAVRSHSDEGGNHPGRSGGALRTDKRNVGADDEAPTDSSSIAPTTALVKLFEQNSKNPPRAITPTLEPTKSKPPPILSPKPQRSISVRSVSKELDVDSPDITVTKPALPPPRRKNNQTATNRSASISDSPAKSLQSVDNAKGEREIGSTRRISIAGSEPPTASPSPRPYLSSSYRNQSLQRISPHMTGDSLANAIVGAALASSRQPTPRAKSSPPRPPSPRRSHHHPHIFSPRSPSPIKHAPNKLKHTLRHDPSSESENESPQRRTRMRHLVGKHPHKHHEGTRKHWRDTITDRERRRYEGVWAANRGLYLPSSDTQTTTTYSASATGAGIDDEVLNLVVRDIWMRSRLPEQVLEEVWFLVDRREVGRLAKEEFVVGLWLIDQRLKGRKLPSRVSESVWASVTGLGTRGIKVRVKDARGRNLTKLERTAELH